MFTATKDLVLPTTVTGSWPRPRWYTERIDGCALSTRLKDVRFREQFTDALAVVMNDQARAGLDILTHGDYFHDEDIGGHAWHRYPLERWGGLSGDHPPGGPFAEELAVSYPAGTILREVMAAWRWPRVVGKIDASAGVPLEYAKIWRLARARSEKPIKFGTVSAQGIHHFLDIRTDHYDDDRRQLIWDMATAMNTELRQLAASGCDVIQIEEPLLHLVAADRPDETELLDFLVDAFNHEVAGLENVEVWVHTCWGNPNMQRTQRRPSYAGSVEIYLDRLNADVWTIELKDSDLSVLQLLAPYRERTRKKIAIGVVSHRTLQVETADEVAGLVRAAMRHIRPENLILSSDCGFGRQGCDRTVALYKAAAIAMGANLVRRELGVAERPVPVADPALQADLLPIG